MAQDVIEFDGSVTEALPNAMFCVQIDTGKSQLEILATISGKIRMYRIKILPGDRVKVALSPYDLTRGRITFRYSADARDEERS